jgi:hypothetical protein
MAITLPPVAAPAHTLDRAGARQFFDEQARELLGISGDEFLSRLDAGKYADIPDDAEHADILYLATLQSIGRRES